MAALRSSIVPTRAGPWGRMETGFPWQLLHQIEAEAACLFQAGPGNRRRKRPRVLGRPQCPFTDSRLCKAAVHSGLRGSPPRPHNRGASHAGVLVWGSGDKPAATFIHLSVRRSRLFVVLGLRSPFPCRLSAESHAQLLNVTHTPGYLAHLSPTALTMQQVPLQLSAPAFPPCGRLEKTP